MMTNAVFDPAGSGRLSNRQRLLNEMRTAGSIGRSALAKRLDISVQAASNITEDLLKLGLIRAAGKSEGGRGLPVVLYDLNPDGAFFLGFEVRPNALYATVTDLSGQSRAQTRIALARSCPQTVIAAMSEQIAAFSAALPLEGALMGAGIVRPGPFGNTGLHVPETEIEGWDDPDIDAYVQDNLTIPITIDNDATAGACAEHQIGCAKGVRDFAYLYFGKGLGLGVITSGTPMSGAFGNSGEIGHLRLPGLPGRLEETLSRSSVDRHMAEAGFIAGTVEDLTRHFDAKAAPLTDWIASAAQALGQTMGVIENLFDPATVVLGGAMPPQLLSTLIAETRLPTRTVSNRPDRSAPRIQVGACGAFTVSVGAAALMRDRFFLTQP